MPLNPFTAYGSSMASQVIQVDPTLHIRPGDPIKGQDRQGRDVEGVVTEVDHNFSPDGQTMFLPVAVRIWGEVWHPLPRTCWERILED